MNKVIEELDDAKAEIEKLRVECRVKTGTADNLKRSHTELLIKIQELNLKLEKQSEEINAKTYEVYNAEQLLEDLKRNLKEKETIIKGLNASNERLRTDSNKKMREYEEGKTELLRSLEEANSNNIGLEQKIRVLEEEIEGLKERFVSVSQKKCSEANKVVKASKEMRERDDMLMKSEEEYRKLEDQLKWKKEQFSHLEEAHQKLHDLQKTKESEWEIEKSTFLDEISTLQENLDSQTRVSEDLQRRLESCNQALAREESRRKCLEIQLSESKLSFESMFSECEEAKSKIECLTSNRDEDIAYLRTMLGEKEAGYKEMVYRTDQLEEENQELKISLKELREAQIQEAGSSKLRNKLKSLEQIHKDCSKKLKSKEAEWSYELETVKEDLKFCRSELESKELETKKLLMELDDCNSLITSLTLQREEYCITSFVLKSRFLESQLEYDDEKAEKDLINTALLTAEENLEEEREKGASSLREMEALAKGEKLLMQKEIDGHKDMKNIDLLKAQERLEEECEKMAFLMREMDLKNTELLKAEENLESLREMEALAKGEKLLMQKEIDGHKDMKNIDLLKAQERLEEECEKMAFLMREMDLKNTALLKAEENLEVEHEKGASLLKEMEKLKFDEEEKFLMQKEIEGQKEILTESFASQEILKEKLLLVKIELRKALNLLDKANDELAAKFCDRNEVEFELQIWKSFAERLKFDLEQNHQMRKELEASLLEQISTEVNLREERESHIHELEEKESRIEELEQKLLSVESVAQSRKEKKVDELEKEMELWEQEWLRKELEGAIFAQMDAEKIYQHEKESLNQIVQEKDERINDLQQIMMSLEKDFEDSSTSFSSELVKMQTEINLIRKAWEKMATALVLKEIEVEEKNLIIVELENEIELREKSLKELEAKLGNSDEEKRKLGENIVKYSDERESLVGFIEELSDSFSKFSSLDTESMETLGRIVQGFNESKGVELFDPAKENMQIYHSATGKRVETSVDERSPLRARNY